LKWIAVLALVGIAPQQIFRGTWLQEEFATIDIGFDFPSQPTGIIRRARSIPSVAATFALKELRGLAGRIRAGARKTQREKQ